MDKAFSDCVHCRYCLVCISIRELRDHEETCREREHKTEERFDG